MEQGSRDTKVVSAVAVMAKTNIFKPGKSMAQAVEDAMSNAIKECYSNKITDPIKVKAAIMRAREKVLRGPSMMKTVSMEGN